MEKVSIDDVEPTSEDDIDRRKLTDPLNTAHVAVNRYVLEPGERFAESLHTHMDQEEVFIIIEGKATFETMNSEVTVSENEVLRFAPGEFQSGKTTPRSEWWRSRWVLPAIAKTSESLEYPE